MQPAITLYYDGKNALRLERMIRQLTYGDALLHRHWRLEYVRPDAGFPCYKLYRTETLVGMQHIRAGWWLGELQFKLAAYLALVGARPENCHIEVGGAKTPPDENNHRLPKLFPVSFRDDETDEEVEEHVPLGGYE